MKKAKFGLGLLVGAVAGVVAGFLTAPKSGKETRDDLRRKKDEVVDKAGAKAEEVKGMARDAAEEAKSRADDLKSRATRAAESAKSAFNDDEDAKKPKK